VVGVFGFKAKASTAFSASHPYDLLPPHICTICLLVGNLHRSLNLSALGGFTGEMPLYDIPAFATVRFLLLYI